MIIVGFFTTIFMMEPVLRQEPGRHRISGWPIAVFVGGFLLPVAARKRAALDIGFEGGRYRWKPPLVLGKASQQKIAETFQAIVDSCTRVGAPVSDRRGAGSS
jgi:hypothetical protein